MSFEAIIFLLIVVVIIVFLAVGARDEKKLRQAGKTIEADYVKTELSSITKSGNSFVGVYKIECEFNDAVTGKHHVFRSSTFSGQSMYYTHPRIKVLVDLNNTALGHEVDLSPLSSTDKRGIFLIETSADLSRLAYEVDGEYYWKRNNAELSPSRKRFVGFLETLLSFTPKAVITRLTSNKRK